MVDSKKNYKFDLGINMLNSKRRCLLIKIYRPHCIVFTFQENLSDEKLPEMKQTFLFFWNLKSLVTCIEMNHKINSHNFCLHNLFSDVWLGTCTFHFCMNLKPELENCLPNKPSSEKWSSKCTTFEWEANWWKLSSFYPL